MGAAVLYSKAQAFILPTPRKASPQLQALRGPRLFPKTPALLKAPKKEPKKSQRQIHQRKRAREDAINALAEPKLRLS